MTEASTHLKTLAERLAATYGAHTVPRAILLTGSAATGESDSFSDLDLVVYYDFLPPIEALDSARHAIGAATFRLSGQRDGHGLNESYTLDGVECQVGHRAIDAWEADMADVIERLNVASPTQKALEGLVQGLALHGEDLIRCWQARAAAYPDSLARAMVKHYLPFFDDPLWAFQDWLAARDATVFYHQILVESVYHLLGVLAGLNRLYYSPVQFKRAGKFIGQMRAAPSDLAERVERLFVADRPQAIADLERLVGETVTLVETHLPEIDTSSVRDRLRQRQQPWQPRVPFTPELSNLR